MQTTEVKLDPASSAPPVCWERKVSASADRMAERMRRGKYLILFLFSVVYFAVTCFRASQKLFWIDELYTLYLSRLPDMASVWNALKQGVDFNPPFLYLFTRVSEFLFGRGQVAARLPEIVGFWIFCLCLFRFASARTSVLAGAISMLFPMVTTAYFYGYEARSHGIVLGFAGIALICWQAASRSRRKAWWLTGLSLALLCAILTHTYAVLLIVPFVLAELTRLQSVRRVDWPTWLAIFSPLAGALVYLPLFRAAKAIIPPDDYPANLNTLAGSWTYQLTPALGALLVALVLYFVFTFVPARPSAAPYAERSLDMPESVALIAFVAMPFFSLLLAKLAGAPYVPRYSISAVAGFGCLLGIVAARKTPVGLGVFLFLLAQIGFSLLQFAFDRTVVEPFTSLRLGTTTDLEHEYEAVRSLADKTSTIVLFDSLEFLPIIHYAPPDISPRLVYSAPDVQFSEQEYVQLQRCCRAPGRFKRFADLVATGDTFIALCNSKTLYRLDYFIHRGADVTLKSLSPGSFLASVTFRKQNVPAAIPGY
jgi:hypothetical protein